MSWVVLLALAVVAVVALSPTASTARVPHEQVAETWLTRWASQAPGRSKREAERSVRRAVEVATGLAAAIEAGLAPRAALPSVVRDLRGGDDERLLHDAAERAELGGDVAGVLLSSQRSHWRALGVAWRVGEESGAAFAPVLDRVSDALRTDERINREARAALAGAIATARMLAMLPLAGVGIGKVVGSNTIAFLFTQRSGWACLLLGLVFEAVGLVWTRALLRKASS